MEKDTLKRYIKDRLDYMVNKYNSWLFQIEYLIDKKTNKYHEGVIQEFKDYQHDCNQVLNELFEKIYDKYTEISCVLLTIVVIAIVFIYVFESDLYPFVEMDKIIEILEDDFATDVPESYFKDSIELMFEILEFIDWQISWKSLNDKQYPIERVIRTIV